MTSIQHQDAFAGRWGPVGSVVPVRPGSRTATHDPRWPAVAAALTALRDGKRRAVRIVDADCGAGCLLLHALRYASGLGFTAIEGRGIDGSPALIGRARAAAARLHDPAVGVAFDAADMVAALREEHELPADIVLCHDVSACNPRRDVAEAIARAGARVIADDSAGMPRGDAA